MSEQDDQFRKLLLPVERVATNLIVVAAIGLIMFVGVLVCLANAD